MRQLVRLKTSSIPDRLSAALRPFGSRNAFNPSVHANDAGVHVSFRAYGEGPRVKPFRAYYVCVDEATGRPSPVTDLTEHAARFGVGVVADPKLFGAEGKVFATFNTGYSKEAENDIFVMEVHPTLGPPQRCVLDGRERVEKNWAFVHDGGDLAALYSLEPLVRLKRVSGDLGSADDIVLERWAADVDCEVRFHGNKHGLLTKRNLSLGSQPVLDGDDVVLMANEKIYLSRWRAYVGRMVRVPRFFAADTTATIVSPRLVHSTRKALPRRNPHSSIAVSVTYFSGATWVGGKLLVGYGVNDTGAGFAELDVPFV